MTPSREWSKSILTSTPQSQELPKTTLFTAHYFPSSVWVSGASSTGCYPILESFIRRSIRLICSQGLFGSRRRARSVTTTDNWVSLPSRKDVGEWRVPLLTFVRMTGQTTSTPSLSTHRRDQLSCAPSVTSRSTRSRANVGNERNLRTQIFKLCVAHVSSN